MKSAGKARNNGLYRHIRTSKEIIRNLLNDYQRSDIFYAIFSEYYKRTNDIRALKMAQYFKYGTDNENEIWMLRYGLSFEDIEILKPYIVSIGQEEIVFSADIQNLSPEQIKPVERYL